MSITQPQPEIVFTARELMKTYRIGEVEVHALRGVNLAGDLVKDGTRVRAADH